MITTFCSELNNRQEYNFTMIDNKIIEDNYTDLSVEAYMVLTRCLANQSGWQINWKLFEKKFKITNDKRISAIKELVAKRHCIVDKWKEGKAWEYNYVFFELALSEDDLNEFTQKILPELRNRNLEFQNKNSKFRILKPATYILYNNITKTNLTNNIKNNIKQLRLHEDSSPNLNNISKETCNHVTCEHDSPMEEPFRREHEIYDSNMENFEVATNLNNSQQSVTNPLKVKKPKSQKCVKGVLPDGTVSRNKAEIKASNPKKGIKDIAQEHNGQIIAEQTEEEVAERKATKKADELLSRMEEMEKKLEAKEKKQVSRQNLAKVVCSYIEQDFSDLSIQNSFKNWVNALCEKGIGMTITNYNVQKEKLLTYPTLKDRLDVLEAAMSKGFPKLKTYEEWNEIKSKYSKHTVPVAVAPKPTDLSQFGLQYDENGNVLEF